MAKNMTDDFYRHAIAIYFWLLLGVAIGMQNLNSKNKTLDPPGAALSN
jgi:hypothetical protein